MSETVTSLDPTIRNFYDTRPEEHRLESGASQLEALRTRQLIQRFAPNRPCTVLDVGGAAGPYALWLSELGHRVHLVEPVPRLALEAKRRSGDAMVPIASFTRADARALPFASESVDFVLLLGPLYHLTSAPERARAWSEAKRVLKPDGWLFAAAISRFASVLDALRRDLFANAAFYAIVEQDLRDGQHRNPTERHDWFTTAYFHHPDEVRAEAIAAGLRVENLFGLEGPGWVLPDFDDRWSDARKRADLIRIAEAVEAEPSMLGVSAHLLLVAQKG